MEKSRISLLRFFNALFIVVLSVVILGAYIYQYTARQDPCPLCELQRLSMLCIAIGPLLNLRFGLNPLHYSISIFAAVFGGAVSLRQISLHVCPGFPTFGLPVLGYELYTWAFIVFCCSLVTVAILLLFFREGDTKEHRGMSPFEKCSAGLVFLITLANAVSVFMVCGIGVCSDAM